MADKKKAPASRKAEFVTGDGRTLYGAAAVAAKASAAKKTAKKPAKPASSSKKETKPAGKTSAKKETKPVEKASAKKETKPVGKTPAKKETKPVEKTSAKKETKPVEKTSAKKETKPVGKTPAKKETKPVGKTPAKKETKPVGKTSAKKETKPVGKTSAKKETKPAVKTPAKKEAKPAEKVSAKKETKPAEKSKAVKSMKTADGVTVRTTASGKLEVITADGRRLYGAAASAYTGVLTGAAKKSADERAARVKDKETGKKADSRSRAKEAAKPAKKAKNVVVTPDGRTLYGAAAAAYNGVLTGAAKKAAEERAAKGDTDKKSKSGDAKKAKNEEKSAKAAKGTKSAKKDAPLMVVTEDGRKLYGAAAAAHKGQLVGAAKKSAEARAARIASGDEKSQTKAKKPQTKTQTKTQKKNAPEETESVDRQGLFWDDDEFLTNLYSDEGSREVDEAQLQRFIKKMHDLQTTARKKKNVLEYNEIKDYLADVGLDDDLFERVLDRMESEGIDVLRTDEDPDDLPDDDELIIEEEEEVDVENIDLSVPDSVAIEDPVRMYLKEIGKVPLLSAEEEIALAKLMEAGIAAEKKLKDDRTKMTAEGRKNVQDRIRGYEKELAALDKSDADELTIEEEKKRLTDQIENNKKLLEQDKLKKKLTDKEKAALQAPVAAGEDAKNRLAEANLRLVVSIAKRYVGRGMLFLDLIQEGNLGLIKAVEKFDFRKGFKFSTYATWWIRQAITRAIADQARTIRIPVHMVETINKLIRISRQLLQELGREPTPDEIAEKMNMPVERVREILKISQEPVSLETPIGEEEDSHLGDFIQDDHVPVPADAAAFTLLKEQLVEVLGTLTEREQKVLRLRFGLDDGRARTLEEVGRVFNVTRERIRQIEAKALRKLRHPSRSRKLKDYLD